MTHCVSEVSFQPPQGREATFGAARSCCFMNMAWRFGLDFKETVERLNCPQNILKDGDLTDTIFGDEVQNVSITMDILTSLRTLSESHCDTLKKNTI